MFEYDNTNSYLAHHSNSKTSCFNQRQVLLLAPPSLEASTWYCTSTDIHARNVWHIRYSHCREMATIMGILIGSSSTSDRDLAGKCVQMSGTC